jgi:hypothetical protein
MVNKKGIIRIIEAGLAGLILLGFAIFMLKGQIQQTDTSGNVYKVQHHLFW